jgi:dihydroorotase-like cyclic amidohydrolase
MLDLVIEGGTVVCPVLGRFEGSIGIADGRIAQIAAAGEKLEGRRTLDASGQLVLPGIIDPHVHLGVKSSFDAEVVTETRAAALGGVTSIGIYLRQSESYLPGLPDVVQAIESSSSVDVFAHATVITREHLDEMAECAHTWGITSFKAYMMGIPGIIANISDDLLVDAMRIVGSIGAPARMAVHAENPDLVEASTRDADKSGNTLRDWHLARPDLAEAEAINRAAFFARATGAPLYIVHLTSADGLAVVREAQASGTDIIVETTSMAMTVDETHPVQVLNKRYPPLRAPDDRSALWEGVLSGDISTIGTDNVTSTRAENKADEGIWHSGGGFGALQTHFPTLFTEAARRGAPLETWLSRVTVDVAKAFGLYPRKGSLQIGADADVVVIDPETSRTADAASSPSRGDWSPYDGDGLIGWPTATIRGGEILVLDGELLDAPPGSYLKRVIG